MLPQAAHEPKIARLIQDEGLSLLTVPRKATMAHYLAEVSQSCAHRIGRAIPMSRCRGRGCGTSSASSALSEYVCWPLVSWPRHTRFRRRAWLCGHFKPASGFVLKMLIYPAQIRGRISHCGQLREFAHTSRVWRLSSITRRES